jgi:hypothetical protein
VDLWKFAAADVTVQPSKGNRRRDVFDPFTTVHYRADTMPGRIMTIETFF